MATLAKTRLPWKPLPAPTGDFYQPADTGVGFESQFADRLFEAFFTTKTDGMGIGLAVSRSIIESHGGRLWAASNDGPGATFSFSIPCDPESMPRAPGLEAIRRPAATHAQRIEASL